jgi:hypothetical protein
LISLNAKKATVPNGVAFNQQKVAKTCHLDLGW